METAAIKENLVRETFRSKQNFFYFCYGVNN